MLSVTGANLMMATGRSENKNMMQFSSFQNGVRPGVVMSVVGFLYSILFYSILFYSILFYSILFYSILFYSILFYSILFYSILFYSSFLDIVTKFDHPV